jgi:NADPH:quinone reductase-like Zn-dependent oxidoreductase
MFEAALKVMAERGVETLVDASFPFADALDAYRHLESGAHMGKVMLRVAN